MKTDNPDISLHKKVGSHGSLETFRAMVVVHLAQALKFDRGAELQRDGAIFLNLVKGLLVNPLARNDLVAPNDAAAMLSVDPKTVSRWANGGKIHAVRTPGGHRRFLRSEILALMDSAGLSSVLGSASLDAEADQSRQERHSWEDPAESDRWAAALVAEAVAQAARAQAEQAEREVVETAAAVDAAVHTAEAAARRARHLRLQAAEAAAEAIAREAADTAAEVKLRADATARELCQSASDAASLVLAAAHESDYDPEQPAIAVQRALAAVAASVAAAEESAYAAVRVATGVAAAAATVAAQVAAEDLAIENEVTRVAVAQQVAATAQARHKAADIDALARATAMVAREAARAVRRHALDRDRPSPAVVPASPESSSPGQSPTDTSAALTSTGPTA